MSAEHLPRVMTGGIWGSSATEEQEITVLKDSQMLMRLSVSVSSQSSLGLPYMLCIVRIATSIIQDQRFYMSTCPRTREANIIEDKICLTIYY